MLRSVLVVENKKPENPLETPPKSYRKPILHTLIYWYIWNEGLSDFDQGFTRSPSRSLRWWVSQEKSIETIQASKKSSGRKGDTETIKGCYFSLEERWMFHI